MTGILHDRLGFEVHRCPVKTPPAEIIIWGTAGYQRHRNREDPKHQGLKYYIERSTQIIHDTPSSGIYSREAINGSKEEDEG